MPKPYDFGEVKLTSGEEPEATPIPDSETPFRILLMGDFSGRENRRLIDPASIAKRRAMLIDRDNFDEVMAKIAPEIHLPIGDGDPLRLRFTELDEFHPDRLLENVAIFQRLRELRTQLDDPATFSSAAEELGLSHRDSRPARPVSQPSASPKTSAAPQRGSGSLLDDMIEQTEARAPEERGRRAPDDVREFARRAAEPLIVANADPKQAETLAVIDRALSGQMRALLHNPDFQSLEAAWRAVFLLVRRLETDSQLKLYLIDISQAELAADLSAQDLRSTGLYRLLVEQTVRTVGAEPWALIAGNFTFGPSRKDAELLGKFAKIASAAGAPFIAGASPLLLGCASLAATPAPRDWELADDANSAAWASLRRMNEATSIGLALPRFLLRLPYGSKTNPIDTFKLEEMTSPPAHEEYLWGNAAFACALLLGQSFSQSGWEMRPGSVSGIDDLPLHVYEHNGESELKPCAEALLTDEAIEQIMEAGLMPLASYKGKDMARLVRFQSIAGPVRALAGRWNG